MRDPFLAAGGEVQTTVGGLIPNVTIAAEVRRGSKVIWTCRQIHSGVVVRACVSSLVFMFRMYSIILVSG